MFEIHVGELRATFLRNHNMRRHEVPQAEDNPSRRQPKPGRQPKQTTQAQKTPTFPATTTTATSVGALHLIRGTTPDKGRCTRYVALHPLRGTTPDMGRCTRYVAVHPIWGGAPVTWRCTRTEEVHCLRIGCSAPTHKNKRGTDTPNHSPPQPARAHRASNDDPVSVDSGPSPRPRTPRCPRVCPQRRYARPRCLRPAPCR